MQFRIDSHIPPPPTKRGGPRPTPLAAAIMDLEIGQSIGVPVNGREPKAFRRKVFWVSKNQRPKHFATRLREERGRLVVRIWRMG